MSTKEPMRPFSFEIARDAYRILHVDEAANGMIVEVNNGISRNFRIQHSLDMKRKDYTLMTWLRKQMVRSPRSRDENGSTDGLDALSPA